MAAKLKTVRRLLPIFLLLSGPIPIWGQNPTLLSPDQAQALVVRALATESRAAMDDSHPMRFRLRKTSPHLTTTKEMIETRDGDVARLTSINDRPLSQIDEQREEDRLNALLNDADLQRHRKKRADGDMARAMNVLRVLPHAFLYQFAGTGIARTGMVEKFTFRPNPQFNPPDLETQILTAMTGEIWIDAAQERVVRLEGHLQQDKDFGLGILGQLNKGGWIVIDQADVGGHQWRIVHLRLMMTGRILFKVKNSDSEQEFSEFAPLPPGLDYRQAIQMLRALPAQPESRR